MQLYIFSFKFISYILLCFFLSILCTHAKDILDQNVDELEDSGITTKIYKSTDQTIELIDKGSNFDPTIENFIINKSILLGPKKNINKRFDNKLTFRNEKLLINNKVIDGKWLSFILIVI